MAITLSIFSKQSGNSFHRWINYNEKFYAPKPFQLYSLTKNQNILGGEKISITIISEGSTPDSIFLSLTPTQISTSERDSATITLKTKRDVNGFYQFLLPELFQDYEYKAIVNAEYFYEAWKSVTSTPDTIFVTDRPKFEEFEILIIPPSYSKLPSETLDGSIASVQALKGSEMKINLLSNRMLKSSFIKHNDSIKYLRTFENTAVGSFYLYSDGQFSIYVVDPRGITNRDPIEYKINILSDLKPTIKIKNPDRLITLGNNQIIQFHLEIEDDYGLNSLQLAYEIRRPEYLNVEPYIAMFIIPELNQDTTEQTINAKNLPLDICTPKYMPVEYIANITNPINITKIPIPLSTAPPVASLISLKK